MNNNQVEVKVPYIKPAIESLTDRDILEEIGPAQAYTGALPFSF